MTCLCVHDVFLCAGDPSAAREAEHFAWNDRPVIPVCAEEAAAKDSLPLSQQTHQVSTCFNLKFQYLHVHFPQVHYLPFHYNSVYYPVTDNL